MPKEKDQFQPISQAKRDGTPYLTRTKSGSYYVAWWDDSKEKWVFFDSGENNPARRNRMVLACYPDEFMELPGMGR